jgi:tRNA-dihydrouridine synthase C
VDLLDIPVIGNGDVTSPRRAAELLLETGCAGVMVGRGAVQDPLVFRRIVAALGGPDGGARYRQSLLASGSTGGLDLGLGGVNGGGGGGGDEEWWGLSREEEAVEVVLFLRRFAAEVFAADDAPATAKQRRRQKPEDMENFKLGKLKQICKYLFASNQSLTEHLTRVLGTKLVVGLYKLIAVNPEPESAWFQPLNL